MIVPAADKPEADLAARVLGESGEVFTAEYYEGASSQVTHYGCNWPLTPNEFQALKAAFLARGILARIDISELVEERPTISEVKTRLNLRT